MALAVVVLACVALGGFALGFLYSPLFRYPTDGEYPPPHIGELIWPTIGYPAMVVPGGTLVVEVDLGTGGETRHGDVTGWKAWLTPSREELAGFAYALEPAVTRPGVSERWPDRSRADRSEAVWHASFLVPTAAPPELYDLRVEVDVGEEHIVDGQPHAVALVEDEDGDFTFITLSDIHVHERDNSSLFSPQTDKGISGDGDPLFLEQAILQVNLIRPDFVLMLGDYVRGQRRPGELGKEYARFYQALQDLEVPAYLIPGNHDGYVNGIDGALWFENNIGPLYYSFDAGGAHFTCLNSYDWPWDDRVVMNKLIYMEPRKWQGQVAQAGDENDASTYGGQLAWGEADLAAHHGAPLKVMAVHHDPYTPDGGGWSYRDLSYFGLYRVGGGGVGRDALLGAASRNRVDMVFGGHLHLDAVGSEPWDGGGGETVYSCQTCVYFDAGGRSDHYPGYRLVEVEDGDIVSFTYLDGVSSFPFYDGSIPGGTTDLDELDRPALHAEVAQGVSGGTAQMVIEVKNRLATSMELNGIIVATPAPPAGGYDVEGGEIYRMVEIPDRPGWTLLYLRTRAESGEKRLTVK